MGRNRTFIVSTLGFALLAFAAIATAQQPQHPANTPSYHENTPSYHENVESNVDVEYGARRPILDAAGWFLGVPRKIMMLDSRVDNHRVSDETVGEVAEYIARKDLETVKVRVNQWDPIGEWQRLVRNEQVSPGWKYTVGALHHLRYTFVPGRLFGGDKYNPFTNTVNLYSDVPTLGMVESAYAHDVKRRALPGTYATAQTLPFVSMWHETLATEDVLRYVALYGTPEEIAEARKIPYSRYGSEMGGEIGSVVSGSGDALQFVGAGVGHLTAFGRNRRSANR